MSFDDGLIINLKAKTDSANSILTLKYDIEVKEEDDLSIKEEDVKTLDTNVKLSADNTIDLTDFKRNEAYDYDLLAEQIKGLVEEGKILFDGLPKEPMWGYFFDGKGNVEEHIEK